MDHQEFKESALRILRSFGLLAILIMAYKAVAYLNGL